MRHVLDTCDVEPWSGSRGEGMSCRLALLSWDGGRMLSIDYEACSFTAPKLHFGVLTPLRQWK